MIEISEATQTQIQAVLAKNPGKYFRIRVDGDGCAGPYFGLLLDDPNPEEQTTQIDGIDFLVSDTVKRLAEISRIRIFINASDNE